MSEQHIIPLDDSYLASDLPSIAALAAAEVDDLMLTDPSERTMRTKLKYLSAVLSLLKESLPESKPVNVTLYQQLNPIRTELISNSLAEMRGERIESYAELVKAGKALESEIRKVENQEVENLQTQKVLAKLKRFCLALSKYSLADRDRLEDFVPIPDYQR